MTTKRQREIVIEFERIQLIRTRAKTELLHCGVCQGERDFVSLTAAAELFGIEADQLRSFSNENEVHLDGDSHICVSSLLEIMKERQLRGSFRMIGDCGRME